MKKLLALMLALICVNGFARTISIMTYNAENLFDTKHDEGKSDWKWLPSSFKKTDPEARAYCESQGNFAQYCFDYNWDERALNAKIQNLAKAIRAYNGFKGPDIVVLQEVENLTVLEQLVERGLPRDNYRYVTLIEGPDRRGIDVGVISRFPIVRSKLHEVSLAGTSGAHRTTRGILEVEIKVDDKKIIVFGNHWPSQSNGDDTRLRASEVLERISRDANADLVVATGDFNTHESDAPHGIQTNVLPYFYDSEEVLRRRVDYLNPGSHWYQGHWTSLDKIFVLKKTINKNVNIIWDSFSIINNSFLLNKYHEWTDSHGVRRVSRDTPMRFSTEELEGYSDHLPVAVKFDI